MFRAESSGGYVPVSGILAFAVGALFACLLVVACVMRARPAIRMTIVAVLIAGISAAVAVPGRVAAAAGTTLFVQSFANNTVNTAYPVSLPALPTGSQRDPMSPA